MIRWGGGWGGSLEFKTSRSSAGWYCGLMLLAAKLLSEKPITLRSLSEWTKSLSTAHGQASACSGLKVPKP